MSKSFFNYSCIFFAMLLSFICKAEVRIDSAIPGLPGEFQKTLINMALNWSQLKFEFNSQEYPVIRLMLYNLPKTSSGVGIEQCMSVHSSMNQVASIVEDINNYKNIFDDFVDIHIVEKKDNTILTHWEHYIPYFFISNPKYDMMYIIDKSCEKKPNSRIMYRYQLTQGKSIIYSDGLIVLEKVSETETRYTEIDFLDAEWGILKAFSPKRILKDIVSGFFSSDVAIKLKSESPSTANSEIQRMVKKQLEQYDMNKVIDSQIPIRKIGP